MDRKDPNEFHEPRGPPEKFVENILLFFTPWVQQECTEHLRTNPTDRGGPTRFYFILICLYPWGPPEWTEKTRTTSTNPGGPREICGKCLYIFIRCIPVVTRGEKIKSFSKNPSGGPRGSWDSFRSFRYIPVVPRCKNKYIF